MTLYELAEQGHTVYVTILPEHKRCGTLPVRVHLNCHQTGMGNTIDRSGVGGRWNQAGRTSWRCLLLVIKAKLEAVESRISTIEQEFLPFIVMPGGRTVAEELVPQIEAAYEANGNAPLRLIA